MHAGWWLCLLLNLHLMPPRRYQVQASALDSSILLLQATGGDYLGLTGPYMDYVVSSGTVTDPKSYSMYQSQVCYIFSNVVLLTSRFATDLACHVCSRYMLWLGCDLFTCVLRADQEISRIINAFPVRLDHLSLVFVCFAYHALSLGILCFFAIHISSSASAVQRLVVCR